MTQTRLFVAALTVLLAWGVLAFGGVYRWAYAPLLIAAPLVGLWGVRLARSRGAQSLVSSRPMALALAVLAAAVMLQLIPLPETVLSVLSPALVALLDNIHLLFAAGVTTHPLSMNPGATATALAFIVALGVLLLGLASALQIIGARRLTLCIVILALAVAVIAVIQRAFGDHRIYGFWTPVYGRQPFGPFVNRNHFAGWMVMAFALSLGCLGGLVDAAMRGLRPGWRDKVLWWSSPAGSKLVFLAAGVLLMGASVVLTMSRSGAAALALAMGLFALTSWRRRSGLGGRVALLAFLGLLVAGIVAWGNTDALGQRFTETEWLDPAGRWGAWSDTIRVTRDFWLTGSGLNTFGDVMLVYQRRPGAHLVHAHSDYLQLASEGGVLVGIPILVAIGVFAREVRRRFREAADDVMSSWIRTGACTALLAIALQEAVEGSLQMPGNAVLFTVIAAIAVHKAPSARGAHAGARE